MEQGDSAERAAQFERYGDGYLYRRNGNGPAVLVSLEEFEFVTSRQEKQSQLWARIAVFTALGLSVFLMALFTVWEGVRPYVAYLLGGMVVSAVLVMAAGAARAEVVAARAFSDRPHIKPALSRKERRELLLRTLRWREIWMLCLWAGSYLFMYVWARDPFGGRMPIWWWGMAVLALSALVWTAYTAFEKRRMERRSAAEPR